MIIHIRKTLEEDVIYLLNTILQHKIVRPIKYKKGLYEITYTNNIVITSDNLEDLKYQLLEFYKIEPYEILPMFGYAPLRNMYYMNDIDFKKMIKNGNI
ncbi:MAG: hypothetical protein LBM96_05875 [Methanobrevibacter sp.]|jgi:hypothetical protein|nr:hypothetical protein [Candidatus Methanoflexus mossambicus]